MAVASGSGSALSVSRSGRIWLDEGGQGLYALTGSGLWRVDLATLEKGRVGKLEPQAGRITGAEEGDALLVTDPQRGDLWILGPDGPSVRIPLGATPSAVAFGPGHRLAYVANPGDWSLSLVDTGVGGPSSEERMVLVGSAREGALLRLDGDGRPRARYEGLPSRLNDLALLEGGRKAVASYTELITTGDPGVTGDGGLILHEGLCTIDLEDGTVETFTLPRPSDTSREASLAWPAAILPLGDGTVAVALPGWGMVAVMDLRPGSARRGELLREIPVQGRPRDLALGALELDWLYVLDESGDTLSVVGSKGAVTNRLDLGR
jgi:DNA-binding beta-propeller fold protein YncE